MPHNHIKIRVTANENLSGKINIRPITANDYMIEVTGEGVTCDVTKQKPLVRDSSGTLTPTGSEVKGVF